MERWTSFQLQGIRKGMEDNLRINGTGNSGSEGTSSDDAATDEVK